MSQFKAGFARMDITPPLGIHISGYYKERIADGILDALEANCVAVSDGENTALLYNLDVAGIPQIRGDIFRKAISEATGVAYEGIFITCGHTHTGPELGNPGNPEVDEAYAAMLARKLCDAGNLAIADLAPATAGYGRATAPKVSFVRRFRMKDGALRTNPGVGNPDIDHPIGTPDETVQVLRLMREGKEEIVVVNFQVHPDTIGGCKYSADYPGFVRRTVEAALPGTKCIYFNGAQGDVNHVNVNAKDGDFNDLQNDFDDVARGYKHSQHMGQAIAGGVLQVYLKTNAVEVGKVSFAQRVVSVPSNRVDASLIPGAEAILALHNAGKDDELPYEGMELTTVVAEATRMKALEHGPDAFELYISAVSFGDVAFTGFPGEPFTDMGRAVKARSPFTLTIPCCIANGYEGYYPVQSAYDEGGYEARSSKFKAGVAELLVDEAIKNLESLR